MIDVKKIVWIDLETGGTDESRYQITQVAAVATGPAPDFEHLDDGFERKVTLIDGRYTKEALDLQAYDAEVWAAEAKPVAEVLDQLKEYCREHTHKRISPRTGNAYHAAHVGGHNVSFDTRFLMATAERNKIWLPLTGWTGGVFDTLHLQKWLDAIRGFQDTDNHKLETLCGHYGIAVGGHDALGDVEATIKLARRLLKEILGG